MPENFIIQPLYKLVGPCIGFYDDLKTAIGNQSAGIVKAYSQRKWHIEIIVGKVDLHNIVQLAEM
jgi:hypothetical protein